MKRLLILLSTLLLTVCAYSQTVVMLGDSNTWIGGDDCSKPRGWNYWFARMMPETQCRSYARSGATWTNTPRTVRNTRENIAVLGDNNVIYNQVQRLIEAADQGRQTVPDVIIIGAGTNDAWFTDKRPDVFSKSADDAFADTSGFITGRTPASVTALADAVRYNCEMLMERFPDAIIVLLSPTQTTKASPANVRRAADIIRETGARMSIPVVSLDRDGGIYAVREKQKPHLTYDGTHTSEAGAKRHASIVAARVKQMLGQ